MRRVKQTSVQCMQRARALWLRVARRQTSMTLVLSLALCMSTVGVAAATATSSSTNYSVSETQFGGAGSTAHQCSTSYCAKSSAGDTTVGSTSSTNYSSTTGSNTTGDPRLDVSVTGGNQDLGTLDNTHTATATSTIDVSIYNSNGYNLILSGSAPSQGTHTIQQLSDRAYSQAGHEQFGVNMVANSSPAIGGPPIKQPSGAWGLSYITSDYINTNMFKYVPGDVLASCPDNGEVVYTLSMIMNISNVTPGGHYAGSISAVVVPIF